MSEQQSQQAVKFHALVTFKTEVSLGVEKYLTAVVYFCGYGRGFCVNAVSSLPVSSDVKSRETDI